MKVLSNSKWGRLISLFTASEEQMRPTLTKPFKQDGYICATDTHVIICVAEHLIPEGQYKYEVLDKPSVEEVMPPHDPKFSVSLSELINAFVVSGIDYSTTTVECHECDNDCEVEWKYTDEDGDEHSRFMECPCCNGTGYVPNAINRYCRLEGNNINAHWLLLLYSVMSELSVYKALVSLGSKSQLRFNLAEGVDIVIMPTAKVPDTYKTPVKIKTEKI